VDGIAEPVVSVPQYSYYGFAPGTMLDDNTYWVVEKNSTITIANHSTETAYMEVILHIYSYKEDGSLGAVLHGYYDADNGAFIWSTVGDSSRQFFSMIGGRSLSAGESDSFTLPCEWDGLYDGFSRDILNGYNGKDYLYVLESSLWFEDGTGWYRSNPIRLDEAAVARMRAEQQNTTAYASTQTVSIDGNPVTLEAYALKDENGNPTNYVKLRDVAYVLNGTAAQFEVGWDGNVNIVTGSPYTPNGSEMKTPFSGDRTYTIPTAQTNVNGAAADLAAISLTDDNGGGYTYYQLRDLGRALGFNVGWSGERGIYIETDKPYTDAD